MSKFKSYDQFVNERDASLLTHEQIMGCENYKKILDLGFVDASTKKQRTSFNFEFRFPKERVVDPFFAITVPTETKKWTKMFAGAAKDERWVLLCFIAYSNGYIRRSQTFGDVRPSIISSGDKDSRINDLESWNQHFGKLHEYIVKNFVSWCNKQSPSRSPSTRDQYKIVDIAFGGDYEGFRQKYSSNFFNEDFEKLCTKCHEIPYVEDFTQRTEETWEDLKQLILSLEKPMKDGSSYPDALAKAVQSSKQPAKILDLLPTVPRELDALLQDYRGALFGYKSGIL